MALATWACGAQAATSVDDVMQIRTLSHLFVVEGSGRAHIIVSRADEEADRFERAIWVVDRSTGVERVTELPSDATGLEWSHTGELAFLLPTENGRQVFVQQAGGRLAGPLSNAPMGVKSFRYSAQTLLFTTAGPCSGARPMESFVTALCEIGPAMGDAREIARIQNLQEFSPAAGRDIIAATIRSETEDHYNDIVLVDRRTGAATSLVNRPGEDFRPVWSPDGQFIAFRSDRGTNDWAGSPSISVVEISSGTIHDYPYFPSGADMRWSTDSANIFYVSPIGTQRRIHRLSLRDGEARAVSPEGIAVSAYAELDGRFLAIAQSGNRPDEIWEFAGEAKSSSLERMTDFNNRAADRSTGELRLIEWAANDGRTIEGLFLAPAQVKPPYPLVVYLHGGPGEVFSEAYLPQFANLPFPAQTAPYPIHAMAARGIAVFMPNPRGSIGHGLEFQQAIRLDWGGRDCADILSGVAKLFAEGLADPKRLGIMGWSYGGYLANWIVSRTDAFAAASSGAGIADVEALIRDSRQARYLQNFFPRDNPDSRQLAAVRSPIRYAEAVRTPLLLQHGGKDESIPSGQATILADALSTDVARHSRVEIYPGERHLIATPSAQRHVMQSNVDWFARWLLITKIKGDRKGFQSADADVCPSTPARIEGGN